MEDDAVEERKKTEAVEERKIEVEPETDKTEKLADLGEDKTDIEDQKEKFKNGYKQRLQTLEEKVQLISKILLYNIILKLKKTYRILPKFIIQHISISIIILL